MNRRHFLSAAAAASTLGVAAQSGHDPMPIFNGKSLDGWTIQEGPESAFYVDDGAIVVSDSAGFPTWLRSAGTYENFDFTGEFFIKGWIDSGIYLHAPEHGRNTWEGMQIKIFHQVDEKPVSNSMGSVFPLVAPKKVNVRNNGEWNTFRIRMDWPRLQVWTNGEPVQDLNVEDHPDLRYRLRRGYLGLASLGYPIRFRNLMVQQLPNKDEWQMLYENAPSIDQWYVSDGKPNFQTLGAVLRGDGSGHIATKQQFRDFELRMYIRGMHEHNGGVLFRSDGKGLKSRHYEIQLHDVEEAHFPTGSLYYHKRSIYPKIQAGEWFPFHLIVQGNRCLVRINGDLVCEYSELTNLEEGHIELQAHRAGYWTEFKDIRIKAL